MHGLGWPRQGDAIAMTVTTTSVEPSRGALEECVRLATLAPSIHNSQPWLFRIIRDGVEVLGDRCRQLAVVDPDGRELHISLGAAVLNLRVAMVARAFRPVVEWLPDPTDPDLVARVAVSGFQRVGSRDRALRGAIPHRRTNRAPFSSRALDETIERALEVAAAAEGARLTILGDTDARALLALVRTADVRLRDNAAYTAELAEWTSVDLARADGVPITSFGPSSERESLPVRDFGLGIALSEQTEQQRPVVPFEDEPTIAVLSTDGDGREDWLRAGVALERVLLEATVAGAATGCMTQPLELPPLRSLYDDRRPATATQMILRLGYAPQPAPTRRRPVREVLVDRRRS